MKLLRPLLVTAGAGPGFDCLRKEIALSSVSLRKPPTGRSLKLGAGWSLTERKEGQTPGPSSSVLTPWSVAACDHRLHCSL